MILAGRALYMYIYPPKPLEGKKEPRSQARPQFKVFASPHPPAKQRAAKHGERRKIAWTWRRLNIVGLASDKRPSTKGAKMLTQVSFAP